MAINTQPDIHELVVCANIFIHKGSKYLLLKRSPHKKFAPNVIHPVGGKVDLNENPYIAAEREVLEEAGVRVKNLRLEAVFMEIIPVKAEPYNWLIFHFSADYDSGEVIETEEGELIWLTPQEIVKQELFPSVREAIHYILNPHDGTVFATFRYDENNKIITEKIDKCAI
jgi:8-oxo-dGTP diphosphatase